MATNAYSQGRSYNNYISPVNFELIHTVLGSKEQKYNANLAKIDATIETYAKKDLARESDKQMLYENINNVIASMEGASKMSLSSADTMRYIDQAFTQAVTPYLGEQLVNTAKMRKFYSDVATLKEKNPEKYSDVNMNYAIKQAGLDKYMNGETDEIGNLNYTEYTNVYKEIQPELDSWAKEFGYETFHEITQSNIEFVGLEKNGKRLTREAISQFLTSRIQNDPKLIQQMKIDSWGKFGSYSDEEFTQYYKDGASNQMSQYNLATEAVETEMKSYEKDSDEYKQLESQLKYLKGKGDYFKNIVESNEPLDRDNIALGLHLENFIGSIAQTRAYDRVESTKYNTTALDVAMTLAENERANRAEIRAEQKELREQEKHVAEMNVMNGLNADGSTVGIVTEQVLPDDGSQDGLTDYQAVTSQYSSSYEQLRQQLASEDKEFATKTRAQQDAQINTIIDSDLTGKTVIDGKNSTVKSYSDTVRELASTVKSSKEAITTYSLDLYKEYMKESEEVFNTVAKNRREGTATDLTALRTSMAHFVDIVRTGKSYDKLTDLEKQTILYEYTQNMLTTGAAGDEREKERLKIVNTTAKNTLNKSARGKQIVNYIDNRVDGKTDENFFKLAGKGFVNRVARVWEGVTNNVEDKFNLFVHGEDAMTQKQIARGGNSWDAQVARDTQRLNRRVNEVFTADEDLMSLSTRDMSFNGENYEAVYRRKVAMRNQNSQNVLTQARPTAKTVKNVSFSKDMKQHVPVINEIKSLVAAVGKTNVSDDSTFDVSFNPTTNKYDIKVTTQNRVLTDASKLTYKNDYTPSTISVDASVVQRSAPRLYQTIGTKQAGFAQSSANPNRKPLEVVITAPTDIQSKVKVLDQLKSTISNQNPELYSLVQTAVKTPSERYASVKSLVKNDTQRQELESLYNSNYGVMYTGSIEEGYKPTIYNKSTKQPIGYEMEVLPASYITNEANKIGFSLIAIEEYINYEQNNILNNGK